MAMSPLDRGRARRDDHVLVALALLLRQEPNERRIERGGAGARQQLFRRAGREHPAGIHRNQPIEPLGLLHIGGGDHDAHAGPIGADLIDQVPELPARQRIDAGRRLIEDQEVRVMDQRAAEAELLLHAAGQLAGRPVRKRAEPGGAQQSVDAALSLLPPVAEQTAEKIHVLHHREDRVEVLPQPLRHIGDPRAGQRPVSDVLHVAAEHLDLSALDRVRAGDERQQAGLADAVGPDQPDHAARRNVQAYRIEGAGLAIEQADVAQADHDRCRSGDGFSGRWRVHCCGSLTDRLAGHSAFGSSLT